MKNKTFYYARVSSKEQNLDRQINEFKKLGAEDRDIFVDKESGANLDREGYKALRNYALRDGDVLVIKSIDRLSRNKKDITNELRYFKEHNIKLKIIDVPTTMNDMPDGSEWVGEMINNILIEVLSSIAEQERNEIRHRQAEGIEAAKLKGKRVGRPPVEKSHNWDEVINKWANGEISAREAMKATGIKRALFYKLLKEEGYNKDENGKYLCRLKSDKPEQKIKGVLEG